MKEAYLIILTENERSAFKNNIHNKYILLYVKLQSSQAVWTRDIRSIKLVFRHSKLIFFHA